MKVYESARHYSFTVIKYDMSIAVVPRKKKGIHINCFTHFAGPSVIQLFTTVGYNHCLIMSQLLLDKATGLF